MQHIILCLQDTDPYAEPKDNATYVQCSRRRYSYKAAVEHVKAISPSRKPVIVPVPSVPIDSDGYPTARDYTGATDGNGYPEIQCYGSLAHMEEN